MEGRKIQVKDDPTNYVVYYPFPCHSAPPIGDEIPEGGCQTVSIDPAPKNFAIRIEKRYRTGYIEPIYMETVNFSQYGDASESTGTTVIDPRMIAAISHYILSLFPIMKESRIIGIERQLAKNYKATRIYQHLLTLFTMIIPFFNYYCILIDISPKLKGKILGAPKGLNYNGLKKWGIEKSIELLTWRNDQWSLQLINHHRGRSETKGDDLADTVIQMEAWFILVGGISTRPPQAVAPRFELVGTNSTRLELGEGQPGTNSVRFELLN